MDYLIRKSTIKDVYGIAHVITISWNETYQGMVPQEELDRLYNSEDERAKKLLSSFKDRDFEEYVLEINRQIVGVIRFGKSHDTDYTSCGEIYVFYIINKYHGLGFGRELFELAKDELKKMGFDKMIIACLKDNPTNEFYKHMGGKYIKDGLFERLQLKENIYYYDI